MSKFAELDQIYLEEFFQRITPASAPRDLFSFARSCRNPPGGPYPGQFYSPDIHPAQMAILRAISGGRYTNFVIVACTQDGKSWVSIQLPMLYFTTEQKEPVVYGIPDMRLAQDAWIEKIKPAFEATDELAAHLPQHGSGSAGGANITTVMLMDAAPIFFLGGGGRNKSGQASRTARVVLVDEFGKIKPELASKYDRRADSFDTRALRIKAGTVENDHADRLLIAYASGTRCRMHYCCPLCGDWTKFIWANVVYDATSDRTARATAAIRCERCQELIDEPTRKHLALPTGLDVPEGKTVTRAGKIVGPDNDAETYSLLWSALDSPLKSLGTLAVLHRNAVLADEQGNVHDLKEFWHDQLAEVFPEIEGNENIEAVSLAMRSGEARYDPGEVPTGVQFCTAIIDQQLRRYFWLILGHDLQGRTWVIDFGQVSTCAEGEMPDAGLRANRLRDTVELVKRGRPRVNGGEILRPLRVAVDLGNWAAETRDTLRADEAIIYLRGTGETLVRRMGRTGKSREGERLEGWYDNRTQDGEVGGTYDLLWIDSDAVKQQVVRSLMRGYEDTGAIMLPAGQGAESDLVRHLTAEKWEPDDQGVMRWVKHGRRNDWWDCLYYGVALSRFLRDIHPALIAPEGGSYNPRKSDDDDRSGGLDLSWS